MAGTGVSDVLSDTAAYLRTLTAGPLCYSWELEQDTASLFVRGRCLNARPVLAHDPRDDRLAMWRHRLEALELLALVWHVDPAGYATLMGTLGFENHSRLARDHGHGDAVFPTFTIAFGSNDTVEFIENVLALVLSPVQDRTYDPAFVAVKTKILALTTDADVMESVQTMRIPMKIVDTGNRIETTDLIHRWLTRDTSAERPSLFTLTGVDVRPIRVQLTSAVIATAGRHVTARFPIDYVEFMIRQETAEARHIRLEQHAQRVADIFAPDVAAQMVRHHREQEEAADVIPTRREVGPFLLDIVGPHGARTISCARLDNRWIREAFLSALTTTSESMRPRFVRFSNVGSDGTASERCSKLLWMLYGLFSQDARHAIETVEFPIFSGVHEHELAWLAGLLRTQAAPRMELLIPEVFDEYLSREPPTTDRWVTVPRGCPIRLDERDDWRDYALRFEDDDRQFRVLRDDPTWGFIDVLVPGYGRGWVDRNETVLVEKPLTPWRFDQHSVRLLELTVLDVTPEEQRAVAAFLDLVGHPLQTLRLYRMWRQDEPVDVLSRDVLCAIVRACPQLERLVLSGVAPVDCDALMSLFADASVSLYGIVFESAPFVDRADVVRFCDALGDSTLPMTRKLRELAINLDQYETEHDDGADLIEALLLMLETNRFLRVVHVGLSVTLFEQYETRFLVHRKRFIALPKAPVPMRAKCALLSALDDHAAVDEAIVSRVFAFAAECETRVVTVAPCMPRTFISSHR